MSRDINDLHPIVRVKCLHFQKRFKEKTNLELKILDTWRGEAEQNQRQAQGASRAKWGESPHNVMTIHPIEGENPDRYPCSLAFDCVPLKQNSKDCDWKWWGNDETKGFHPFAERRSLFEKVAEECGLDWMGDSFGDYLPWDLGHLSEFGWKILVPYISRGEL